MQDRNDQTFPARKNYEAPRVTDYGTLKEQTANVGNNNANDGLIFSS